MKKLTAVRAILLAGFVATCTAKAADLTWTNGDGLFSDGLNWDSGIAPVVGDNTRFTNDTSYTVSFNGNSPVAPTNQFAGHAGTVTIDVRTFKWTTSGRMSIGTGGSTATVYLAGGTMAVENGGAAQLRIADATNAVGTLVITNGTLRADTINVGASAFASGTLIVRDSGMITNSLGGGTLTVGNGTADSQLIITNGGQVYVDGQVRIGNSTGSSNNLAIIADTNSVWNVTQAIFVGQGGGCGNRLVVSNGAQLLTTGGTIGGGNNGSSFNTGIVVGAGSAWISSDVANIVLGSSATNSHNDLLVYDGGFFSCGGSLTICNSAANSVFNSVHMGGPGAMSTGSAPVVRFASGTSLNSFVLTNAIFNSGTISFQGTSNSIFVLANSTLNMTTNLTTGGSAINAVVTINGGTINNAAGVLIGAGSSPGGLLVITNGGKLVTNYGTIGANNFCTGIVAGVGSVWSNLGPDLMIGTSGNYNYLAVRGGGSFFNAGTFSIGNSPTAGVNSVCLGGIGSSSTLINSGSFNIGASAGSYSNKLTVTNSVLTCNTMNVGVTDATNNLLELQNGTIVVNFIRIRPTNSVLFTAGTLNTGRTTMDTLANNGRPLLVGDGTSAAYLELAAGGTGLHDFNAGGLAITNNATLRGNGTLLGNVTVLGTWAPGFSVGTIVTSNNLTFGSSAVVAYDLGTSSDFTEVNGNLALNGTLNITSALGFGVGTYSLFSYTGILSGNGLAIGTTPDSGFDYAIDTNTTGQVKLNVTIPPPPVAIFSGSPVSGAIPLAVTFTDSSSGTITNRFWDFGDGNTTNTTATSFNHAYAVAGVYSVSLTVDGRGGSDTNSKPSYITALNPPHLVVQPGSLTFGAVTIGQSNSLTFSAINTGEMSLNGTAVTAAPFEIMSGGSYNVAPGQTQAVSVAFVPVSAGSFNGSVIFTSNGGVSTNAVSGTGLTPGSIAVAPTTYDFGGLVTGTVAQVSFIVTNSGGTAVSNGTAAVAAPFSVASNATFSVAGFATTNVVVEFAPISVGAFTNNVVFVTDNGGARTSVVLGVSGIVPAATFSGTPTNGTAPLAVTFTNASSGSITNSLWDFGDGHTTNTMAATLDHTYSLAGTNTVSLTVYGPVGSNTQILTEYIVATNPPPPVAAFSGTPTNGSVPLAVAFTNASTGNITNSFWDFGDGTSSNTMTSTFVHTYNSAGTNTVSLFVSGLGGSSSSTQINYIVVLNPAHLVVNPGSLSFGSVTIGLSNNLSFAVVNTGDLPLSGTATSLSPFSVTSGGTYNNLVSGQTQTVTVAFAPSSPGATTGSVFFASDGGVSTNTVTGTGLTPGNISVSPVVRDFGVLATGTTIQASFVVTNSGGTAVSNGIATALGGPFTIVAGASFSVPGFGTSNITVRFAPVGVGAVTNSVAFATDNGGNATNTVIGEGAAVLVASFDGTPTNGVTPLAVTFTDASTGTITNRFWNFGDGTITNTMSTSVSHTYSNSGSNTVSLTLFGPLGTTNQTRTAYVVALTPAHLVVNPGSLSFGSVTIGLSNSLNFSVINTGDMPLSGTATSATPFSVGGGSYSIAGGQTQTMTVAFEPGSAGAFTGSVIFASDGGNSTNTVIGTGVTPGSISVAPSPLGFGTIATGTTAQLSFVVTNSGGTTVSNGIATALGGPFTIVAGASFSVPGFGTSNITVRFAPVGVGAFTNFVAFATENGGLATNTVIGDGAVVPLASFTGTPTNGALPLAVTFNDNSSGTITNRFWDFGDGAITNTGAVSVSHTYTVAGTNTVILTVTGPLGLNTQTRSSYIVAHNPPVANFNASPTVGSAALAVTFTDSSTGNITNRFWNFGDGHTTNTMVTNLGHTYDTVGTNSVSLTVFGMGGWCATNRPSYVIVTNFVLDATPPQLQIVSPTDYEGFTNANVTIVGVASDVGGVNGVTVNGSGVAMVGTNWSQSVTLSLGTNTFVVIATDASANLNTATQTVHAVLLPNHPPQITATLSVTNALVSIGNTSVVVAGETNIFSVSASDIDGNLLNYQWAFGDGHVGNSSVHIVGHVYTNDCGPYNASVTVTDGQVTTNSTRTVVVACAMQITKMQLKLSFAKTNIDSYSFTATIALPSGFTTTGTPVVVDVGGAQSSFTLDAKGKGLNALGSSIFKFNKKTLLWTVTAKLGKTNLKNAWADEGLGNITTGKTGVTVNVTAAVLVNNEAFAADRTMLYKATAGKTGSAK